MFIKRLDLFGFKTFAEKTEFELSAGITAIVGPNGCGKSNIADALSWVLGESNIRNLRGQRATDVIFNGSEKRKALGMAEVTLTLDNSCGTLPISFSEVTVTRRAYRSGEAEYLINKARCRLKDIYEMFLDTGIGREAYSTISQGEIDAVLSAKPEDRRELFEEAAGIKKYRYRRQEALRKLEKTEGNLQRVRDIMSEIGGQLEPLKEQAEQAKRYQELTTRLREIEIGLLIRDLRRNTEALTEVRDSKSGAAEKIAAYDERLAALEADKDRESAQLAQLEEEVDSARRLQMNLSGNVQRLESRMALIDERMKSADASRERTDQEIASLEQRMADALVRRDELARELAECESAEVKLKADVEARAASLAELDRRFDEASRDATDQRASRLEMAKALAAKRGALQTAKDRVSETRIALDKLAEEITALEAQSAAAVSERDAAEQSVQELQSAAATKAEEISALQEKRSAARRQSQELSAKSAELARQIAGTSARLSALRELAESHEGFFEGVRSVMDARRAGRIKGEYAVVADVISVPKGCETAIEVALGASVQDIIADTVEEAKAAIAFLKENRAGRATFLPLDNVRPHGREPRGDMSKKTGALGIAADMIDYDPKYEPAIRMLLGGVVVADSVDNAVELSRRLDGWHRIVTLEGELIVQTGAITGGARKGKGSDLLLRKQEIDTLATDLAGLDRDSTKARGDLELAEQELAKLSASVTDAEKAFADTRIALAEQQKRVDFTSEETARLEKQLHAALSERSELERAREEESAKAAQLESDLNDAGREDTDLDRKVAGAEEGVEDIEKQRAEAREELMSLNVELAGCSQRAASLGGSADGIAGSVQELTASLESRRSQVGEISTDSTSLSDERGTVNEERVRQHELLEAAEVRFSELTAKRTDELERAAAIDAELRDTGNRRNRLAQDTHDADVKEARLEVQVTQAVERLLEEYEVTHEQALDWPEDIEVERGTATEVARLRREIRDMGPVNIGAVQEYDRIKERWDFLSEQRADLEAARDQVNEAIREIDVSTRGLFMDTFNRTAEHFDVVFKRLFGGGRAQLSLTNPDDLLETGIDVVVQAPGKKLQDLALLSGGERALTATALVFALLMTKPSPFVVMDEVDAPLDESNVERFAEVLKEFSRNSQFIVITHNRATMEAADSLYGVAVQEPGISKLISVRLTSEGPVSEELPSGVLATS